MSTRKTGEIDDPLAEVAAAQEHFSKVLAAFGETPDRYRAAVRQQFLTATNAYGVKRPRKPRDLPADEEGPEIPAEDYGE